MRELVKLLWRREFLVIASPLSLSLDRSEWGRGSVLPGLQLTTPGMPRAAFEVGGPISKALVSMVCRAAAHLETGDDSMQGLAFKWE
ncbi:hypothetical protein CEXT_27321 [Caerostris extrusa]|uniref:Uncharacterized protein n=1 Tax=Caerostris extrusa TaxID=172846 RepID=A0AAV4X3S4_CAEEX|nr:hypothetical protein CEXT_27321 [Caerostris extrusa]